MNRDLCLELMLMLWYYAYALVLCLGFGPVRYANTYLDDASVGQTSVDERLESRSDDTKLSAWVFVVELHRRVEARKLHFVMPQKLSFETTHEVTS